MGDCNAVATHAREQRAHNFHKIEECIEYRRRGTTLRTMIANWRTSVAALVLIISCLQNELGDETANNGGFSFLVFAEEENKNTDTHVAPMAIRRRRRKLDESSTNRGVDGWEQASLIAERSRSSLRHALLFTLDQSSTCSSLYAALSTPLSS